MTKAGWPHAELIDTVFLPYFNKNGEDSIKFLVNGSLSKNAFLSAYKYLSPIENMPDNEKKEMKQYVISLFPEKTTLEKMEACKIIYSIGNLI